MTRLRRNTRPSRADRPVAGKAAPTEERVTAIRELLHAICAAADGRDLAPAWGTTDGPESHGARFVIDCPAGLPFETIGVIPWPDETYGGVDVRLRHGPWVWAPIERAFGPFREQVQIAGAPRQLVVTWDDPTLPATAHVMAWVGTNGLRSLSIRRDPRPQSAAGAS